MKVFLLIGVFLALVIQTEAVDSSSCTTAFTSCTISSASCSALKEYFTCLKNKGCTEDNPVYKAAISNNNFSKCSGVSLTVSSVLAITMMVAARFFSE